MSMGPSVKREEPPPRLSIPRPVSDGGGVGALRQPVRLVTRSGSRIVGAMPDRADAIVVLGCRVMPSGRPTTAAARRARTAAEAYFRGVAAHVVASGGRRWGGQIE